MPRCEDHGVDLKVDAQFGSTLYDIASRRVPLILAEAVKYGDCAEQLAEERYTFLLSKSFFDVCMDVAHKKWKWTKIPLKSDFTERSGPAVWRLWALRGPESCCASRRALASAAREVRRGTTRMRGSVAPDRGARRSRSPAKT